MYNGSPYDSFIGKLENTHNLLGLFVRHVLNYLKIMNLYTFQKLLA